MSLEAALDRLEALCNSRHAERMNSMGNREKIQALDRAIEAQSAVVTEMGRRAQPTDAGAHNHD